MQTGTISHGTLRPQDLIPAFLRAVETCAPGHAEAFAAMPFGPIPAYVQDEGDDSEWWHGEDADALLEQLTDILESHAPEGHYFGAHPGDGSDFGFWPNEE